MEIFAIPYIIPDTNTASNLVLLSRNRGLYVSDWHPFNPKMQSHSKNEKG